MVSLSAGAYAFTPAALAVQGLQLAADATLSASGSWKAAITNAGTLRADRGALTLSGAIANTGTLLAGSGASITLAGGGVLGGALAGAGAITLSQAVNVSAATTITAAAFQDSANLTLAAGAAVGLSAATRSQFTATAGHSLTIAGASQSVLANQGRMAFSGQGQETVQAGLSNTGTVLAGSAKLAFLGPLQNDGLLEVTAGLTSIAQGVSGAGTLAISAGATLALQGGAAATQSLAFIGKGGMLDLAAGATLAAGITGLAHGDVIDLQGIVADSTSLSAGTLSLLHGGVLQASLHVSGLSNSASFTLQSDQHGGTLLGIG